MGEFNDDGEIRHYDHLWRRFIILREDGRKSNDVMFDDEEKVYAPTTGAFSFDKSGDGMSSYSLFLINTSGLTPEDIVNNEDMPQKYLCGIAELSVTELKRQGIKFQFNPVKDEAVPNRGQCHVLWCGPEIPPKPSAWRRWREEFMARAVILETNQERALALLPPSSI